MTTATSHLPRILDASDFIAADDPRFIIDAVPSWKTKTVEEAIRTVTEGVRQCRAMVDAFPFRAAELTITHNHAADKIIEDALRPCPGVVQCDSCKKWTAVCIEGCCERCYEMGMSEDYDR